MSDMISEAIAASGARPRKFRAATAESTLRQADDVLYRAKHAGRNRVEGALIAAH